jgi:hypothetical protein
VIRNRSFGFASGLKQVFAIPDRANGAQNHVIQLQNIALLRVFRFDHLPGVGGDFVISRHGRVQHPAQIFEAGAAVAPVNPDKKASVRCAKLTEFM